MQGQMTVLEIIGGALLIIFAIAISAIVLLQEGHQQGIGVVSGGADTFLSKNRARSIDNFLSRWTKFIAIGFFVLVVGLNVLVVLGNKSAEDTTTGDDSTTSYVADEGDAVGEDVSTIDAAEEDTDADTEESVEAEAEEGSK